MADTSASVLALGSALGFGTADFAGGQATRRASVLRVALISNLVGGLLALLLLGPVASEPTVAAIGWGAASGVCGLAGIVLLYLGLARGPNTVVSPLSAIVAAAVPVLAGLIDGDQLGGRTGVGLVLAPFAIWLVAGGGLEFDVTAGSTTWMGIAAGLGFGSFFACIAQVPADAGVTPLIAARAVSTGILAVAAGVVAVRGRSTSPAQEIPPATPRGSWTGLGLAVVAGVLDMSGNALFLWAANVGQLAVVAVLTNLFPVVTIALAIAVLGERLARPQIIGVALTLTVAALLS